MTTLHADPNTSTELRVAIGRVAHRLRQLWALGEARDGISFTEGALLTHLIREGASSPTSLAGNERVTSQAITAHLTNLAARGLIRRSADPTDGRKIVVTITPAGSAALAARERTLMHHLDRALESLGEADRRALTAAGPPLARLAGHL